ncbi:hypothetical protein KQX54_004860 [Cotesia glomerata]|uniref:Uncharacterized protein n=1 Tax=Cotesia glomerata TaxID=32391 RepID=A0AAV7IWD9_COTGL|nr:hypothetical protein KQX54_004860 [Cotesia glomerata]
MSGWPSGLRRQTQGKTFPAKRFRELTDKNHTVVSDIIINSYYKNFVQPKKDEGYSQLVKVNFVPKFKSEANRKLYSMYLLEK